MSAQQTDSGAQATAGRPRGRWLKIVAVFLCLLLASVLAVLGWLVATQSGLQKLVELAETGSKHALSIQGARGRLIDDFSIESLQLSLPDLHLQAHDVEFGWSPMALIDSRLVIGRLHARRLQLATRPSDTPAAPAPPPTLALPMGVRLDDLRLGEMALHAWAEQGFGEQQLGIGELAGKLAAGQDGLQLHAVSAVLPWGKASASGRIGGERPFALDLAGELAGSFEGSDYRAAVSAAGDLLKPQLDIEADSRGVKAIAGIAAQPFEPVPVESVRIEVTGLDPATFNAAALRAALTAKADLRIAPGAGDAGNAPAQWVVSGPVDIANAQAGPYSDGKAPLRRLLADMRWEAGALVLEAIDARLMGKGRIQGKAGWQPDESDPLGRFDAALAIQGIDPQALDARLPAARLAGSFVASGDGGRQKLRGRLSDNTMTLALDAVHEDSVVSLHELRLTRGEAVLAGTARLVANDQLPVAASLKLQRLNPQALVSSAPVAALNADIELGGQLQPAPRLQLGYRFDPSTLEGHELGGEGRLTLIGERLADIDLRLALAGNRVTASGGWGGSGDALQLALDAAALDKLADGLRGSLQLDATLAGTAEEPSGRVRLSSSRLVLPDGTTLSAVNADGRLERGLDGPLAFAAAVGELRGADRTPLLEQATLSIDGTRSDHRVEVDVRGADGDRLDARLQGGLGEDLSWKGMLQALATRGRLELKLGAPASLSVSRESAELGAARLSSGNGVIDLSETAWGPEGLRLRGSLSGLGFGLVHDADGRIRRDVGELRLGGEWDVRIDEQINGLARLYRESGDLVLVGDASARFGLKSFEALVSATDGVLAVSLEAQGRQLGRLSGSATAHAERSAAGLRLVPDAPILGSAVLNMPSIGWLGPLVNANLGSGGALEADFSLSGTTESPQTTGRIYGNDLELNLVDVGVRLSGGTLEAFFDQDYLRIAKLEFVSPNRVTPDEGRIPLAAIVATPGRFAAAGGIRLSTGEGRFGFLADRLPLLQRSDRWLAVSGEGGIDTALNHLALQALLKADGGAITIEGAPPPSLSDDVYVLGQHRPPARFAVSADVTVRMGDHFYLSALGLDTRLGGGLDIRVRSGESPTASGVIRVEEGVYEGYGQKLAVESSTVNFNGPIENPSLNIVALRKGLEVEAGVSITGTARRPKVRLVSFPNVPDAEKLAWVVLGRRPDVGSGADLGLLIPAAQALLGGPGGGMTSQLSSTLGLDQFSIGQGDLNSANRGATSSVVDTGVRSSEGTVSGQVVTLGKRLSADTFLAFEQSLVGAESIVKLTHQLGQRVSVIARGGTDNALDIFYTFSFR